MRDLFPGYFPLSEEEFDALWKNALVVPDANILLHLLRYGETTRTQILDALTTLKPRLAIPYRVAFEFSRRWRSVDSGNRAAYEKIKQEIRSKGNVLAAVFNGHMRHQIIEAETEKAKIEVFIESVIAALTEAETRHPPVTMALGIIEEINKIVSGSVLAEPSADMLSKQLQEGARRFNKGIPPGFADKNKDGDDAYGDYFIWEEMISVASARKLPVIFVSDDQKKDWMAEHEGKLVGPRPELMQEFWKRSGERFYIYSLSEFLRWVNRYKEASISEETIAEVEKQAQKAEEEKRLGEKALVLEEQPTPTAGTYSLGLTNETLRRALEEDGVSRLLQKWREQDAIKQALAPTSVVGFHQQIKDYQDALKLATSPASGIDFQQLIKAQQDATSSVSGIEFQRLIKAQQDATSSVSGIDFQQLIKAQQDATSSVRGIDFQQLIKAQQDALKLATSPASSIDFQQLIKSQQDALKLATSSISDLNKDAVETPKSSATSLQPKSVELSDRKIEGSDDTSEPD